MQNRFFGALRSLLLQRPPNHSRFREAICCTYTVRPPKPFGCSDARLFWPCSHSAALRLRGLHRHCKPVELRKKGAQDAIPLAGNRPCKRQIRVRGSLHRALRLCDRAGCHTWVASRARGNQGGGELVPPRIYIVCAVVFRASM